MPEPQLRKSQILDALRRFIGGRQEEAERPIECVFSLNPQKRNLYLLDLKAILRLPDARLALPNVANLDITVRRNHDRIRIPYAAMLPLVRELLTVRHRVPARSPLVEIMTAVPGLVNTALTGPASTSASINERDVAIRLPGIPPAEQEAEVARIRAMIAGRKPASPANAAAHPGGAAADARCGDMTGVTPRTSVNLMANSKAMTPVDQRQFLEKSAHQIESIALSTHELSDEDMAGFVDLCILNGDHERVVAMLVERVAEQPRAWAWTRLLELAEALRDPRFTQLRSGFFDWARQNHPELIPEAPAAAAAELFYGVHRSALREIEQREIGARPAR
jgi:hypothetical protein